MFNVGSSDENYRIREVAEIVGDVVPDCEVSFADGASPDKRDYRVDCGHIARTLGYRTTWDVRRGVEQLYAAYTAIGLSLDEFEGPKFQRIAHIREQLAEGRLGHGSPPARLTHRPTPTTGVRATGPRPRPGRRPARAPTAGCPAPRAPRASRRP